VSPQERSVTTTAKDVCRTNPPGGRCRDDSDDTLMLAEQAEARAAEAEALAVAARADAVQLRRRSRAAKRQAESSDAIAVSETAESVEYLRSSQDADHEGPYPSGNRSMRRWTRVNPTQWSAREVQRLTWVLAISCSCALVAASGYMGWHHRQVLNTQHSVAEFASAARQSVVVLLSLDFRTAKRDVQRILDNSTGRFHDDFQATADELIKMTQESKVHTEAVVHAVAVQSHTNNSAVVLVAASTSITTATQTANDPRSWRLNVSIARDGGQLKMSKVEFVQ